MCNDLELGLAPQLGMSQVGLTPNLEEHVHFRLCP